MPSSNFNASHVFSPNSMKLISNCLRISEMARHNKGSKIPETAETQEHDRIQRLLPSRTHSMGKCIMSWLSSVISVL